MTDDLKKAPAAKAATKKERFTYEYPGNGLPKVTARSAPAKYASACLMEGGIRPEEVAKRKERFTYEYPGNGLPKVTARSAPAKYASAYLMG